MVPTPKVRVINLTFGGIFMAKYSEKFKIKLVTEYLMEILDTKYWRGNTTYRLKHL